MRNSAAGLFGSVSIAEVVTRTQTVELAGGQVFFAIIGKRCFETMDKLGK